MPWSPDLPEGAESFKVKYDVVPYTRGKVLDLGAGPVPTFPHWIRVDNLDAVTRFGADMQGPRAPHLVADCARLSDSIQDESVDAIFSSHLLEHIDDTVATLKDWWRCIKAGGHLVLYLPHADFYPRMGQDGSNPDHKHDFHPVDIREAMSHVGGWDLMLDEVRTEGAEYSFLQVFRKRADGEQIDAIAPRPPKSVCVVRYGGFGDSLQAANLLPELKRRGYHVTFMTTPRGYEILREDPHIDAWVMQDDDQVPNEELTAYWAVWEKKFDKFVQLSESVEGTLLAMPGRANHAWPHAVRDRELNKNYLEWTAELAELPYHSEAKFYPDDKERAQVAGWLNAFKAQAAGPLRPMQRTPEQFVVVWCLSGSSMHKTYPHQDAVIARILDTIPEAIVVLTGDYACKILEAGWEDKPRVKCASGELGIRETLTLAQMADLVIGPETGVLNAVAFEPMAKVVFLSHSSKRNLSMHWANTTSLTPANTSCYPCHRLHIGMAFCREDPETGTAACQKDISPGYAFDAVARYYGEWKRLRELRKAA